MLGLSAQTFADRLRYTIGWLPRVNPVGDVSRDNRAWLPAPSRACLVISADLELAWAWRYVKGVADPQAIALKKAEQTRCNLPVLLKLFDDFKVPVTWATVGHLFLEHCACQDGRPHPALPRPPYFENDYWRYKGGDWFDDDPCSDYRAASSWYAPDLIRAILSTKAIHEIACHTFSHIDCSDEHCPPEVIGAELAECQRSAAQWGIALKSFVFPGNLPGNFAQLKRNGFTSYRWHGKYELDVPQQDALGLWQIPGGVLWEKPAKWPVDAWIKALKRCVDRMLERGTVLHFWFHPSCDAINVEKVFPAVLEYLADQSGSLWTTTMAGLIESVSKRPV